MDVKSDVVNALDRDACQREATTVQFYWLIETIIGLLAILGNGLVLLVILFGKVKRTSTNVFIANLAAVDFCKYHF